MLQACTRRASQALVGSIAPAAIHAFERCTSPIAGILCELTPLGSSHCTPLAIGFREASQLQYGSATRGFASAAEEDLAQVQVQVDEINELFTIARDEIEYAQEESETVYFNDAVVEATAAVDSCLAKWSALLESLPEGDRHKLQRSMGLKMEQLKAEFEQVKNLHLEDH